MAPRAIWKGVLKIAEVTCPVALYTAASTSERIAFHTLNRKTGHRVHRQYVDEETGKPVAPEDQVKGYDRGDGDYIMLELDEIADVVPESDKTLTVETFVTCGEIDDVFLDRPYYVSPASPVAQDAFTLIRDGMKKEKVAAIARTVIFRRLRSILIRAHGDGLIATTLDFDYEVRSAKEAFSAVPRMKIAGEMLDLAKHIIDTKAGEFDPKSFDDRYESALADLVKAKIEGKKIKPPKRVAPTKVVDLMAALRESAKATKPKATATSKRADRSKRETQRKAS